MIPGVQNPHCEPPVATNASTRPSRDVVGQPVERGHRPARDPRRRRDAGDAGVAVDEDRAAAALTLGRAAVLDRRDPSRSRRTDSSDSPSVTRPRPELAVEGETRGGSAERLAAAAGALRVRVGDVEPGALEAVAVVERPPPR